jgi:hypothetical protein
MNLSPTNPAIAGARDTTIDWGTGLSSAAGRSMAVP